MALPAIVAGGMGIKKILIWTGIIGAAGAAGVMSVASQRNTPVQHETPDGQTVEQNTELPPDAQAQLDAQVDSGATSGIITVNGEQVRWSQEEDFAHLPGVAASLDLPPERHFEMLGGIGGLYGGTTHGLPLQGPDGQPLPYRQPDGTIRPWQIPMASPFAEGSEGVVYYAGHDWDILRGLTTERLVQVQEQLVAVGLATRPLYGRVDDNTLRAFETVLSLSNRTGRPWESTLTELATDPRINAEREFQPAPYLQPDYVAMADEVKAVFRSRLGRDPDALEMEQLVGELTGFYAREHEAVQELQRIQFEQQTNPDPQPAGTVQHIDPAARFRQLFEQRYQPELQFIEDKQQAQVSRRAVEGTVDLISRATGGGI